MGTGDLTFAISVLDNPELDPKPAYPYVWQTAPATIKVEDYIGGEFKRPSVLVAADGAAIASDLITVAKNIQAWTKDGVILNGGSLES